MFQSTYIEERESFRVVVDNGNGPSSKLMTESEYKDFLNAALDEAKCDFASLGVIEPTPDEFVRAHFDPAAARGALLYRLKAGSYPVLYDPNGGHPTPFLVHHPETLWHIRVNRGIVTELHVYCLFDGKLDEDTILWRLPFSNVYSDGRICIGGNKWKFKSLNDFNALTSMFFSAAHENALYNPQEHGGMSIIEMLNTVAKDGVTKRTAIPVGSVKDLKNRGILLALK